MHVEVAILAATFRSMQESGEEVSKSKFSGGGG